MPLMSAARLPLKEVPKRDDQQLVLADFIFVAGVVLAGVAGVAAEVLGV